MDSGRFLSSHTMSWLSLDLDPPRTPEPEPDPKAPGVALDLLSEQTHSPARPAPFGASALVHLLVLLSFLHFGSEHFAPSRPVADAALARPKVFLPPMKVLRTLTKMPPPRVSKKEPEKEKEKDRISVGAPIPVKQREPLILHKDDDLTRVAKGRVDGGARKEAVPQAAMPSAAPPMPPPATPMPSRRLAGLGTAPILASLKEFESRPLVESRSSTEPLGLPSGTGQQMGPLFFDPQGADFTAWLNHFKNEIYRNWIVPQAAQMGMRGQVQLAFTVERNGTVSAIDLQSSSGAAGLDHAAQNALAGSRLLPLPADFHPIRVTMQIVFIYG
jgi:protein TonB